MTFKIDGKCLCYHGPLLYEARILRVYDPDTRTYMDRHNERVEVTEEDKIPKDGLERPLWFIHYQGWKATWDEWVGRERIRPYNEENLALKRQLVQDVKEAAAAAKRAKSKGGSSGSGGGSSSGLREHSPLPRGRGHHQHSGTGMVAHSGSGSGAGSGGGAGTGAGQQGGEGQLGLGSTAGPLLQGSGSVPKITVRMPVVLKSLLVDDWELITKERKLVELPCAPSVHDILAKYYKDRSAQLQSPVGQALLHEFVEGVALYFDQSLSHLLLYRLERLQFDEVCGSTMPDAGTDALPQQLSPRPSTVYGGIHLVRLISLIPELIAGTTMDEKSCHTVVSQCESLLNWIGTRIEQLIPNKYINTSAQYEGVALGM
ncbi:Eaf3p Ecym_8391 [Eremothecium cymbalariae DBVPG|uniref:Chromatin modification-related protein EAF3 n=1 Tax=Eremothecium cymbalariae (strain CBS 270.75 / DBVPG 7215 / KCTC 17166 / NRRL Y-17582) TaxID=931890 RepID=G8JXT7_ERECY|nr:Hypothetical protein Ecym_8391 [Eremothecium cymbalariae DBVPG\